ncbi:flavin reductase family protein [Arthrobacter sp. zg-Y877]|uniref:flavin reductase family protein n=1 Tax=Arthrobacter sp. zg-Y877 TaxID=3049074 RepID=UPI0025A44617|nr:flavin reductase family protein [Arthrobacter sp. zg-Y877]MDM7989021.1 flavin reductase family protein [Arthrobacter sp. zg-Y877]
MEHGVFPGESVTAPDVPDEVIDRYRELSADIASGVGVVSTRLRGRDYAATVSGFLSVSYDPPTLLVSLYAEARIAEAVLDAGSWVLSLLPARLRGTANWLASPGSPLEGLLNQVDYGRAPETGAAVIEDSIAWFEVRTTQVMTAATHQLIVGEVVSMGRRADADDESDPLLHFASAYARLGR